ncbi:MAG: hypothetical protein IT532_14855 [Burkholderiales bacterium]|nr:hypothetical protein [Burkholderiales bacterium]MCL4700153.1 hypothetical protein [Burkholderiaceae bacterium]
MRKSHPSHNGHEPEAGSSRRHTGTPAGSQSAIAHRIRVLRAEARAVYAEMTAAVLITRREKK